MGEKSYLKDQVRLVSLTSYDFFTSQEMETYQKILDCKKQLDDLDDTDENREERDRLILEKNDQKEALDKLVAAHADTPRMVRLDAIMKGGRDSPGVYWKDMKSTKMIAEFSSELTRAMGLKDRDCTLDLIVVNWKKKDILKQLVMNGFKIPILNQDGTVTEKSYRFFTSSAGQLRRDKILCISDDVWDRIHERLECGLTEEVINKAGGANQNKVNTLPLSIAMCY